MGGPARFEFRPMDPIRGDGPDLRYVVAATVEDGDELVIFERK